MTREQNGEPLTSRPLGDRIEGKWDPKEILYTRYTYSLADPARTVFGLPGSYVICRTDVETFVKERLVKPLPDHVHTRVRATEDIHPVPVKPADIYVGCPCYVVIELDPALDWQFRKGVPGIGLLGPHSADNAELRHVMGDGSIVGPEGPTADGCRMIYFKAGARREYEHQTFRCMFERSAKGTLEPDQVDPDIPNDGGKFPFIPVCPQTDT